MDSTLRILRSQRRERITRNYAFVAVAIAVLVFGGQFIRSALACL